MKVNADGSATFIEILLQIKFNNLCYAKRTVTRQLRLSVGYMCLSDAGLDKLQSTSSNNRLVLEDVLWNHWTPMHDGEYRCGNISLHDPTNENEEKTGPTNDNEEKPASASAKLY